MSRPEDGCLGSRSDGLSHTAAVSFAVMDARRCHDALTFDQDFAVASFRA